MIPSLMKNHYKIALMLFVVGFGLLLSCQQVAAEGANITVDFGNSANALGTLDIMMLLILLALAPSMLLMMTSFTRIMIVFSFLRNALGTQQSPPTQVLVGLSLFLSLFIMSPVISEINETAYQPYSEGIIEQEEALDLAQVPIKTFMLKQIDNDSLDLFLSIAKQPFEFQEDIPYEEQLQALPLTTIVPAFVTSELKRAFLIGFLLFVPFLVIDLIVASTLMSMGMVMLPPALISLPFKIMIFILADGWGMLMGSLVKGYR
ncbi:MAG: flagellar type III secretion system pore protein FliP [Erysipelotrichaceae bacterium]